jgi:hypothetical protein
MSGGTELSSITWIVAGIGCFRPMAAGTGDSPAHIAVTYEGDDQIAPILHPRIREIGSSNVQGHYGPNAAIPEPLQ